MPAPCCDHEADSAPAPLKLTVWQGLGKPDLGQAAGNTACGMNGETQAAVSAGAPNQAGLRDAPATPGRDGTCRTSNSLQRRGGQAGRGPRVKAWWELPQGHRGATEGSRQRLP